MAKNAKSKAAQLVEQVAGVEGVPDGFEVVSHGENPFKNPGDVVTGIFAGMGEPLKMKGKDPVPTYKIKTDKGTASLLASVQLVDFFNDTEEGQEVWIRFDGQVKGGKGRVNRFTFARKPV